VCLGRLSELDATDRLKQPISKRGETAQAAQQSFPKWKVSTNGGLQPRWRPDGTELYFIAPDGKLMTVPVTGSDGAFEFGMPVALFPTRLTGMGPMFKHQYAVSRDGRFLISQFNEESANAPVTLILNWKPKPDRLGELLL
jgi:eukaryotic-like serine/threonine-protein kinase